MDSFVLVPNRGRLRMHASTKDLDFAVDRHHGRPNEGSHRSRLLMSRGLGVRAATRGACARVRPSRWSWIYDLAGLAKSVRACIDVLTGDTPPDAEPSSSTRAEADLP